MYPWLNITPGSLSRHRRPHYRRRPSPGAIVNEAGIDPKETRAIEIPDRSFLVEISDQVVDRVIAALRAARLKGKRLSVRLDKATGRRVPV